MNPDELTRQWADVRHAAAFSGGDIFHKAHPEVSAKKIKLEILPTIPTYQKYRAVKTTSHNKPIFSCVILGKWSCKNRGFQYILIVHLA